MTPFGGSKQELARERATPSFLGVGRTGSEVIAEITAKRLAPDQQSAEPATTRKDGAEDGKVSETIGTYDETLGAVFGGTGTGAVLRADFLDWVTDCRRRKLLPPALVTLKLQGVRVPPPPKLDPMQSLADQCMMLVNAVRGALESRYGKRSYVFSGSKDLSKSKYFKSLSAACAALLEHDIAPAVWCAWSIDWWKSQENGKGKKEPPTTWVLSAQRIDKQAGWCKSETGDNAARVLTPTLLAELRRKAHAMDWGLWQRYKGGRPDDLARRAMAHFFPDGFDNEVEAARRELDLSKVRLMRAAERGMFLW